MANDIHRSRSNTSLSARPISRASTTSIHSFDQHDQSHDLQSHFQQSMPVTYGTPYNSSYVHAPLQPALIQAAQQASQQESLVDDESLHQLMAFANDDQGQPNGLSTQSFSHGLHSVGRPHRLATLSAEPEEKKKKGSTAGSATNDKELRAMLAQNEGRALKDVAQEVVATDRTPKAEKSKQLFAMLWLKSVCRTAKTSVPRSSVYSKYAERCGTERVIPLNPASFGKLVRVIFPGIQTRRLGVRGESKYHYVDLALVNDDGEVEDGRRSANGHPSNGLKRQTSTGPKIDFNSMPRLSANAVDFPQDQGFDSPGSLFTHGMSSKGRLFTDIYSDQFHSGSGRTPTMYDYDLKFATPEQLGPEENAPIVLPDITPFLPAKADSDAVEALVALYRTHCTSLIDAVRYCKERQFFRLFASFYGTLTVPVQKLFAQRELVDWIRECDWMMYQKMIRNISQLTLQVAPVLVLEFLDRVAKSLYPHLNKVFSHLPIHTLGARLEPATLFAHLLRQMLRVNQTAHAAAVMLTSEVHRENMWADWKAIVNAKRVIENDLPQSCGHEEVYNILTTEIRSLLLPLKPESWSPTGTYDQGPAMEAAEITNETVIDRIAAFVSKLPSRFPHAPARTILHCVNAVGTAVLREITVEGGQSFQHWWLTKVFIDEMGQWLASLGGFLDHNPQDWNPLSYSPGLMDESMNANMANGGSGSNNESRYSSMDAEFAPQGPLSNANVQMQDGGSQVPEVTRHYSGRFNSVSFDMPLDLTTSQQEQNLDDSGIGLVEDVALDTKFNFASTLQSQMSQQLPTGTH